jgi:hypothetical protein
MKDLSCLEMAVVVGGIYSEQAVDVNGDIDCNTPIYSTVPCDDEDDENKCNDILPCNIPKSQPVEEYEEYEVKVTNSRR